MHSPLASPSATRNVLERHGFRLKKSLGQNFLVNDDIVGRILELAEVQPGESILEVGTGIGTLTAALLGKGASVVAIERDPSLREVLSDTLFDHDGRWALIQKDALDVTVADVEDASRAIGAPSPSKLVANLPYAVAATVVLKFFQDLAFVHSETVMVQREVAERMVSKPGTKSYGAYTVKLSMFAEAAGSFGVGPGNFMPAPHVESTVIRLDRVDPTRIVREACGIEGERMTGQIVDAACIMADAAFAARRKTIANSCKQYFSGRDADVASRLPEIFSAAEIDTRRRGETLSRADFLRLGLAFIDAIPW